MWRPNRTGWVCLEWVRGGGSRGSARLHLQRNERARPAASPVTVSHLFLVGGRGFGRAQPAGSLVPVLSPEVTPQFPAAQDGAGAGLRVSCGGEADSWKPGLRWDCGAECPAVASPGTQFLPWQLRLPEGGSPEGGSPEGEATASRVQMSLSLCPTGRASHQPRGGGFDPPPPGPGSILAFTAAPAPRSPPRGPPAVWPV